MNPMKYRKATWTTAVTGSSIAEKHTAAAVQVQRLEEQHRREKKILDFMSDLKALTEKHGVTLKQGYEDVEIYEDDEQISYVINFYDLTANAYIPPIPRTIPKGTYPVFDMVQADEHLKKIYGEAMMKQLEEPSYFSELLTKLRKS